MNSDQQTHKEDIIQFKGQITKSPVQLTDVVGEKDNEEWSHQVINPLHIPTGWVPHRPNEQDPLKTLMEKTER